MSSVTITVNGREIVCRDTDTLLNVCLDNGIYIPHLCSHPMLPSTGGCGLCLVQIDGAAECVRACTLKARDGMSVATESEEISRLRRITMELILSEHPEDCSSCPVFGKCTFQSVIQYVGASNGRFRSLEKHFGVNRENPLFVHDMYRCIKCGRCVRACRDIRGVGVMRYKRDAQNDVIVAPSEELLTDAGCRFCGACVEVCPTGALRDKEDALAADAPTREAALIPCSAKCPAHVDIPRYVRHIKNGELQLAVNTIREKVAFPASLGYVCRHFCEEACRRGMVNGAVSVRELKKTAALADDGSWKEKLLRREPTGKRVAVIGAGPAGLTAALDLVLRGSAVTVYEKNAEAGGMLRYGIPEYRLPLELVRQETADIQALGVEIRTGCEIASAAGLLKGGYDAVIAAVGAACGSIAPVDGASLDGVTTSIEFLHAVRSGAVEKIKGSVAVIGGGNVAFDCARTAVRLGAEHVRVIARKPEAHLRCDREELTEAKSEGVEIIAPVDFTAISGTDKADGVTVAGLKEETSGGRSAYVRDEAAESRTVAADIVIFAIGQKCGDIGLEMNERGFIRTNGAKTAAEGVFAAGDAVTGTKSVIEAIASGHRAADAVTEYLGQECVPTVKTGADNREALIGKCAGFAAMKRTEKAGHCPFSAEEAKQEALRCLQCDLRAAIAPERIWTDYKKETAGGNSAACAANNETAPLDGCEWRGCITPPSEGECAVHHLLETLETACAQSCGECEVCRLGCRQLRALTKAITEGEASSEELDNYLYVADGLEKLSACSYGVELGGAIKKYMAENAEQFEQHIRRKKCAALVCRGYITYHILPAQCTGCGECGKACPADAIMGGSGEIHVVDRLECVKCGRCMDVCPAGAVVRAGALKPKTPKEPVPVGTWKK